MPNENEMHTCANCKNRIHDDRFDCEICLVVDCYCFDLWEAKEEDNNAE